MDMYGSLISPSCVLNEQIARQIFDILPEQGPIIVIMDRDGKCWPSDSEEFFKSNVKDPTAPLKSAGLAFTGNGSTFMVYGCVDNSISRYFATISL